MTSPMSMFPLLYKYVGHEFEVGIQLIVSFFPLLPATETQGFHRGPLPA